MASGFVHFAGVGPGDLRLMRACTLEEFPASVAIALGGRAP